MVLVANTAPRSLTIIINFRLYRSTIAPTKGEMSRNGKVKDSETMPRTVALLVFWKAQIVSPKPLMFVASTEINWPNQTMVKPGMPDGPDFVFLVVFILRIYPFLDSMCLHPPMLLPR